MKKSLVVAWIMFSVIFIANKVMGETNDASMLYACCYTGAFFGTLVILKIFFPKRGEA